MLKNTALFSFLFFGLIGLVACNDSADVSRGWTLRGHIAHPCYKRNKTNRGKDRPHSIQHQHESLGWNRPVYKPDSIFHLDKPLLVEAFILGAVNQTLQVPTWPEIYDAEDDWPRGFTLRLLKTNPEGDVIAEIPRKNENSWFLWRVPSPKIITIKPQQEVLLFRLHLRKHFHLKESGSYRLELTVEPESDLLPPGTLTQRSFLVGPRVP